MITVYFSKLTEVTKVWVDDLTVTFPTRADARRWVAAVSGRRDLLVTRVVEE